MSTRPIFRFYLKDKDSKYLTWDSNARAAISSATKTGTELPNGPEGWDDTEIKTTRNNKYWGLFREYSTKYKFVLDGAKILRHHFYSNGLASSIRLQIDRLNSTTQGYEFFFEGDLDFTQITDDKDFFEINIMESGVVAMLKAYEDVEYDIPLWVHNSINVRVPKFLVKGEAKWLSGWPAPVFAPSTGGISAEQVFKVYEIPVSQTYTEVANTPGNAPISFPDPVTNAGTDAQNYEGWINASIPAFGFGTDVNYLFKAEVDLLNVKVKAKVAFFVENNTGGDVTFNGYIAKYAGGSRFSPVGIYQSPNAQTIADGASALFTMEFNTHLFSLTAGDTLFLYFIFNVNPAPGDITVAWEKNNEFQLEFQHYTEPFICYGARWYRILEEVLNRITGGKAVLDSSFLTSSALQLGSNYDNRPYNTVLTSGDAIRGIPTKGGFGLSLLKTTLSDLFRDAECTWGVGLSVEGNKVVIRLKREFCDKDSVIYDLGEVVDFTASLAADLCHNKIKVGYNDQEYETINGRDEYNTTLIFKTPVLSPAKEFNLVSPYRADIYGIYKTWAAYAFAENKDSVSDNNIFKIEIANSPTDGAFPPLNLAGAKTGIIDPDNAFNFGVTPKRNLLRNGGFIRSMHYGMDAQIITYQSGVKNPELSTTLFSGRVDENADVPINSLQAAFFKPIYFTIQVQTPKNLITLMDSAPYGCFRFTYRGSQYTGFPMDVGMKPGRLNSFTFKLLCAPDVDLSTLVH